MSSSSPHTSWPAHWTESTREAAEGLAMMAQKWDAQHLFVATIAERAIRPVDMATEGDYGPITVVAEILAFCLSPFFAHSPLPEQPLTPIQVRQAWEYAEKILYNREAGDIQNALDTRSTEISDARDPTHAVRTVHGFKRSVRSTAYPEQTARQINEIQGRFDSWFASQCGIAPQRAVILIGKMTRRSDEAARALVSRCQRAYIRTQEAFDVQKTPFTSEGKNRQSVWAYLTTLVDEALDVLTCSFEEIESHLDPPLQRSEWDSLIVLLALTPTVRQQISGLEEMRSFPLFLLRDERLSFVDFGHTMDILWEVFDLKAKTDAAFYQKYQSCRAQWLEEQTAVCLERIFGADNVTRSLVYPNPDRIGDEAELDVLALWGNFGVMVECKAKQFRVESQLKRHADGSIGNTGRLVRDLVANVVDPFRQTQRVRRFVEGSDTPVFKEKATKRPIPISKSPQSSLYPVTVSLFEQGGIANYRAAMQNLGLFPDGLSSLALTIWELDIISQFCDGPDVFLHYIERRIQLQAGEFDTFADELDHFGCYLESRLHSSAFEIDNTKPKLVLLSGWSSVFDLWMSYKRGDLPESPPIELIVPSEIKAIQNTLRDQNEEWSRLMLRALLEAHPEVLRWVAEAIRRFRAEVAPGAIQSSWLESENTIWCVTASRRGSRDELQKTLETRLILEQYQHRSQYGVGFGLYLPDPQQAFSSCILRDAPWEENPDIEELM